MPIPAVLLALAICPAAAQSVVSDTLELDKSAATSVQQILSGRTSGVLVLDRDADVNTVRSTLIRGLNAIHGDSEPLWVVDGVMLSSPTGEQIDMLWQEQYKGKADIAGLSTLDFLNLYDIESIEVLKNTTATSEYGSRGANGVIVIRTKNQRNEGKTFELRSGFGSALSGFLNNNSASFSSNNGRTAYRLSGFYRGINADRTKENNGFGGAAFSLDTRAGKIARIGLSSRISMGNQSGTAEYDDKNRVVRTIDNFNIGFEFIPGLLWRTDVNLDYQNNNRSVWFDVNTPLGAEFNKVSGISMTSRMAVSAKTDIGYSNVNLKSAHHFNVGLGAEVRYTDSKMNTMNGTDILVSELRAQGFPYRGSADSIALYGYQLPQYGIYARMGYDYDGFAGVSLFARMETTPDFGRKWNVYPSASAYVDFHKMLLKDSRTVSTLKLEGGYGWSGLNRFVPYYMMGTYVPGFVPVFGKEVEPFLKGWQDCVSKEWNVSVSGGFLQDRFTVSATYYDRKNSDVLSLYRYGELDVKRNLWKYAGQTTEAEYSGDVSNRGAELDFYGLLIDNSVAKWSVSANFTYNDCSIPEIGGMTFHGISTTASFYGVTAQLQIDGYKKAFLSHADASLQYDVPLPDRKIVKGLSVFGHARFLKDYLGVAGPLQSVRLMFGIDIKL